MTKTRWWHKTVIDSEPVESYWEKLARERKELEKKQSLESEEVQALLEQFNNDHEEALKLNEFLDDWDYAIYTNTKFDKWVEGEDTYFNLFSEFAVGDEITYFGFGGYIVDILEGKFLPDYRTESRRWCEGRYNSDSFYSLGYYITNINYQVRAEPTTICIQYLNANGSIQHKQLMLNELHTLENVEIS